MLQKFESEQAVYNRTLNLSKENYKDFDNPHLYSCTSLDLTMWL